MVVCEGVDGRKANEKWMGRSSGGSGKVVEMLGGEREHEEDITSTILVVILFFF